MPIPNSRAIWENTHNAKYTGTQKKLTLTQQTVTSWEKMQKKTQN